jgi:hypothetical protein
MCNPLVCGGTWVYSFIKRDLITKCIEHYRKLSDLSGIVSVDYNKWHSDLCDSDIVTTCAKLICPLA